jgi:hypothetical protein
MSHGTFHSDAQRNDKNTQLIMPTVLMLIIVALTKSFKSNFAVTFPWQLKMVECKDRDRGIFFSGVMAI